MILLVQVLILNIILLENSRKSLERDFQILSALRDNSYITTQRRIKLEVDPAAFLTRNRAGAFAARDASARFGSLLTGCFVSRRRAVLTASAEIETVEDFVDVARVLGAEELGSGGRRCGASGVIGVGLGGVVGWG